MNEQQPYDFDDLDESEQMLVLKALAHASKVGPITEDAAQVLIGTVVANRGRAT